MSPEFYKILHLGALFFVFASIGGVVLANKSGALTPGARKLAAITHGVALLVVFVAGFGMLKYVGVSHNPGTWPGWLWAKFVAWLFLGAALVLARKKPDLSLLWWIGLPLVGFAGAWLALYKPF